MFFSCRRLHVRLITCASLPVVAASLFSPAYAAELLQPMTVTAYRQPSSQTLAPVTVITRADIERWQINDLPGLLSRQVGIDMTVNGGLGQASSASVRGTNADHVLVLVDGVKWYSATMGRAAIQDFPVEQIERIEIVRGPRSGLYGSEAIGGVIQIFTRQGRQGVVPFAKLGYGSHDTKTAVAGLSGGNENTGYHLGFNHQSTEGINAKVDVNPDKDGYHSNSVTAKLTHRFGERVDAGLHILRTEANNETDPSRSLTEINFSDTVQQVMGSHLGISLSDAWRMRFELGESRDQRDTKKITDASFSNTRIDTRHRSFSWLNAVDLNEQHHLLLGFDFTTDDIDSSKDYAQTSRVNRALFASWQAEVDRHSWMLGLRHDDNQAFGSENTGNAEYGYRLQNGLLLTANAGTAFKAPTFNDLYWPASASSAGNPDLLPEQSKSFTLGLSKTSQWAAWSLNLYQNRIRNLIDWQLVSVSPNFRTPSNIAQAKINGLEFDVSSRIATWDIVFNASLLQPENEQTDKLLPRRAKRLANLAVDKQWQRWAVGASLKLRGHSFDDADNSIRLQGYGLLDLRVGYQLDRDWKLQASISNVFDKAYMTVDDYNSLDRTAMLTLSYQP